MSDYHFSVTQIKRSAGQTAIAAAAYRAGEKLYSDYYGEYSDYTKKSGVIESGILLPSHLPKAYEEREFLWNEVEKIEKHPKAQLAYSFDFSLQNEFPLEENIEIARQFIRDNFVSRGMIADYAIHLPERGEHAVPNPHVHVLCPIRPMEPDGTWGAKQHRVTRLDEIGNPILGANGKPLFDAVPTTDWGSAETLEQWRAAWAEINNEHFAAHGIDERLDHRSYEKQGISILPTVHEGPNVREMEKKGIRTDKGDRNRWVKTINRSLRQFASRLRALVNWIAELKAALQQKPEPSVIDLLDTYIKKKSESAWSRFKKTDNLKEYAEYVFYLETHDIHTVSDLEEHILEVNEKNAPLMQRCAELRNKLKDLDSLGKSIIHYEDTRPTYEKWRKMVF